VLSISRWIKDSGLAHIGETVPLWALTALATATIAVNPIGEMAFHAPTLGATFETAMTLCSLISAWLFGFSFVHRRCLRDLLLVGALVAAAVVNVASYYVLPAFGRGAGGLVTMPLIGTLLVSAALAAAAFVSPDAAVGSGRRPVALAVGAGILAGTSAEICGALLPRHLVVTGGMGAPGPAAAALHPFGVGLAVAAAALFITAAVWTASRPYKSDRSVSLLLASGFIVLAAAALRHLTLPAFAPHWVAPAEGLRLVGYAAVLVAGLRREAAIRRSFDAAALTAERRRIANDLHDGLAQDLAFIAAEATRLSDELGGEHPLAIAAKRAFAVSRGAIIDLSGEAPTAAHRAHGFRRSIWRRSALHRASDTSRGRGRGVEVEVLSR
jgi:signal transduction histidine kinase